MRSPHHLPSLIALVTAAVLSGCAKQAPPPPAPPATPPVVEEVVPDAPFCAKPVEKTAFDVAALKTRLVISALACGDQDRYNGFITKNRNGLVAQEKNLTGYFSRNFGKKGQTAQDDYITQLANMLAQKRTKDTATFCADSKGIFDAVAAVKSMNELTDIATNSKTPQPMKIASCN